MKSLRKIFIGGNWKCNNTLAQSQALVQDVINKIQFDPAKVEVLVSPTFLHIPKVSKLLENKNVLVSSQNISQYGFGAYTGETSLQHLQDFGVHWTLLGHSERRTLFHEDDELIAKKTAFALKNNISVVLCIGEQLKERESNKTLEVVETQLKAVLEKVEDKGLWNKVVIAYEPVWAIGTGKVATPQQAQDVHAFIRKWLHEQLGKQFSESVRIIYGGSVNEKNCEELIEQEDIDGFLIGGASLKKEFKDIVEKVGK